MWFLFSVGCVAAPGPSTGTDDTAAVDSADTGDSADSGGPAAMEVGDVVEMTAGDADVSLTVVNAGTYVVQLVSLAETQGRTYNYGDAVGDAARADEGDPAPGPATDAEAMTPRVLQGDERTFKVNDGSGFVTVTATATKVTDAVVLWEDQTTPNGIGSIDADVVDGVMATLETIVLPRERLIFGQESDVDGDPRLQILLSYTVNEYGAVAYVTQCDIGRTAGCGGTGNNGEIVYLGVPDPEGNYGTVDGITETVAHELNHLIYGWHRFVGQDRAGAEENIYITEGMSALAQDLTGYNNGNQYVWAAAIDATDYLGEYASVDSVSVNDFLRGDSYYDADRDGTLRGASYLYLRYLFEQAGGMHVDADGTQVDDGGMAFLHAWFDSAALGADTVEDTTGRPVDDTVMDWYTALVCTGLVDCGDPRWTYTPRVADPLTGYEYGVDPYDTIHGWLTLHGPPIQRIGRADGALRAGGVEYLQVQAEAGETIAVPVEARAEARARLIRIE